ncbi:hypothetical protein IBM18_005098 [Escherichia coli]|nr:hypothetical protein [Escherichia coli]EFK4080750.1 hypothetical protein [Escherichia coli]EGE9439374.1 hypothetical protein [Escherichia coli]EGG0944604.1 hypothetical protein [Escherichia coli]EGM8484447.1 hypothetical protein [Escherichia coli]EHW5423888.1 hypothetical protein [Escherichia coli]
MPSLKAVELTFLYPVIMALVFFMFQSMANQQRIYAPQQCLQHLNRR